MDLNLFPKDRVIGVFGGFSSDGGSDFRADLVIPYMANLKNIPFYGAFILIEVSSESEALLGRITNVHVEGEMSSQAGQAFLARQVADQGEVSQAVIQETLRYKVEVRMLGLIRMEPEKGGRAVFIPSHRRVPHLGSKVAFPSPDVLKEIAGHNMPGVEIGHLCLGEFLWDGHDGKAHVEEWMHSLSPSITPKFDVGGMVSKRTVVFARAGFGKSNLVKLLFSSLYKDGIPRLHYRNSDARPPVGTLVLDVEGEYAWPDNQGRPGFCDVPGIQNRVAVFTDKEAPSPYYASFTVAGTKVDIRELSPAEVVSAGIDAARQEQQNVRKLKALPKADWRALVNEIYAHRHNADDDKIAALMGLRPEQTPEINAARANMVTIVDTYHSPGSKTFPKLLEALRRGYLCVFDLSAHRGPSGLSLSSLILQRIFKINQEEFTAADSKAIPCIMVLEEAQAVLNAKTSGSNIWVDWAKEGRKYGLGAVLVTQQPSSLPNEILSQADNWFTCHLVSTGDLKALKDANAHFSDDILKSLLNEPIVGQTYFWSSGWGGRCYPLPMRAFAFENLYSPADPNRNRPKVTGTPASTIEVPDPEPEEEPVSSVRPPAVGGPVKQPSYEDLVTNMVSAFRHSSYFTDLRAGKSVRWGDIADLFRDRAATMGVMLPGRKVNNYVVDVLTYQFGEQDKGWEGWANGKRMMVRLMEKKAS